MTNSREAALQILQELETKGTFLSDALSQISGRANLSEKDQSLLMELTMGTVRMQNALDYYLDKVSKRPMISLLPVVRSILRLGAYQILYLDRIPVSAAVNESVKLAHKFVNRGVAGFINAVLRNLDRRKDSIDFPSWEKDPTTHIVYKHSHPRWLVEKWTEEFGIEETLNLCIANNQPSETTIRVNELKTTKEELRQHFLEKDVEVKDGRYVPDILVLNKGGVALHDPRFSAGHYYFQDESSAFIAHAMDPQPGDLIYDLCSAPGGKSTHMAQLMNNQGKIISIDQNPHRLEHVRENAIRLGITNIEIQVGDAMHLGEMAQADRVLVDAPCSGLGVIRHKPDVKWRKKPNEISDLVIIQRRILSEAQGLVKAGGTLVYSTCTITREENQDMVSWFLTEFPNFKLVDLPSWFPQSVDQYLQILPHIHQIDGFFIAKFKRTG
ncbi:MAG: 16S rRNA (cytosine(967)-C(5))-methyltransferase RsmB [Firmicutes bacterium]|nr:16S rRNA (cytosine(967)-C(5))-methyltransferase RsmB [Bacillota bacterium]